MKNGFLSYLLMVGFLVFFGCASNIPITQVIFHEVGGVDNTPEFQYYVSKTITLKLVAEESATTIEGGQLIRRSRTARERILIPANLPGLVREYRLRDEFGYYLKVAFENYEGDPIIWFGQYRRGTEERHYILYEDVKNRIIKYGNDRYVVSYDGDDPPYLLIKMKKSDKETSKARKASGLKLGQ